MRESLPLASPASNDMLDLVSTDEGRACYGGDKEDDTVRSSADDYDMDCNERKYGPFCSPRMDVSVQFDDL